MHWFDEYRPRVLPAGWRLLDVAEDGARWLGPNHQTVIMSGDRYGDGKRWLHLSTAFPSRLPRWREVVEVRDVFLGRERKAIQVLAPASEHVNINRFVLHLWHCVDGDVLPDFTNGRGMI